MPEFKDLPDDFRCPYRDGCPYLEGLSTGWVFHRYQEVAGTECHYEYQLEERIRVSNPSRQSPTGNARVGSCKHHRAFDGI